MRANDVAVARQAAALLLAYPEERAQEQLPLVAAAIANLPASTREPLQRLVDHLLTTPLGEQQRDYVATLDQRPRCCLYLTWWTHGDTRERGRALVAIKQVYRDAGAEPPTNELPDHLAVVLEFAATVDGDTGTDVLIAHRPALELLQDALTRRKSPYADVLVAVRATLPPPTARDQEAVQRIAAAGPPRETVGLEPYAVIDVESVRVRS